MTTAATVGRIVHYSPDEARECWAAIVAQAAAGSDSKVTLHIFPPDPTLGVPVVVEVPYSATPAHVGTWHWPEGTREHMAASPIGQAEPTD